MLYGWFMKYYNYEFNYCFLSVGLFIFTCYCGGQAWLSAGTWFNDTYVMNSFYQLFFSLSLMSNNVPATTNWFWFWLPALWSNSILQLSLKSIIRGDAAEKIFLGNFRRRRKRLTSSSLSLFCLLTSGRPHHLLYMDWSEVKQRREETSCYTSIIS